MLRAHIQYPKPGRGLFPREEVSAAAAEGNAVAVEYWHTFFMPGHFTDAAKSRYGYKPRSGSGEPPFVRRGKPGSMGFVRTVANPKYFWRKQRSGHGTAALVYTGRSREEAANIRITSTATRGTGVLFTLPKYFYAYRKDLKQPDKAAELTIVLDEEAAEMGKAAAQTMAAKLNGEKVRPTRAA